MVVSRISRRREGNAQEGVKDVTRSGRNVLLLMSAAIVLVLTALPASAAPQEELDPPRAPLEPEATVDAILPAPKPYNCYGYTDDPHVSRHEPGYAITLVRTECKIQASSQ